MSDEKTCSRPGCGKKLRSDNTKGVCSSGCLATGEPGERPKASSRGVLKRFRTVAQALGKDPNAPGRKRLRIEDVPQVST